MDQSKKILPLSDWTKRAHDHEALLSPYADSFLKRRSLKETDPVYDFLFTYYSFSPTKLKQWVPSIDEELVATDETLLTHPWFSDDWFSKTDDKISLKKEKIHQNTAGIATFIHDLCHNIINETPKFGCFGLHEWAMVYKASQEEIRHKKCPLRLSQEKLNTFVESQTIICSHYDAYRFFTPSAKPLNILNPLIETRLEMEQGGCIHANMDLYKWSVKLWPWIGSDFIAKAFLLAAQGRELDMRASPYDLTSFGYSPICIETDEGRKQYQKEQQQYAKLANTLRYELKEFCASLLKIYSSCQSPDQSSITGRVAKTS